MIIFRFSYKGQVAKHRLEVKKAVFCENTSQVQNGNSTYTEKNYQKGFTSPFILKNQNNSLVFFAYFM